MTTILFRTSGLPVLTSILATLLLGCGGSGQIATAPVHGTITFNGKPVSGGSITFQPVVDDAAAIAGKPASAVVQEDGTYVLTTYEEGDGAVVGTNKVTYMPYVGGAGGSHGAPPEGGHAAPVKTPNYMIPQDKQTVEVKPGEDNVIDFELVGGSGGGSPAAAHGG